MTSDFCTCEKISCRILKIHVRATVKVLQVFRWEDESILVKYYHHLTVIEFSQLVSLFDFSAILYFIFFKSVWDLNYANLKQRKFLTVNKFVLGSFVLKYIFWTILNCSDELPLHHQFYHLFVVYS